MAVKQILLTGRINLANLKSEHSGESEQFFHELIGQKKSELFDQMSDMLGVPRKFVFNEMKKREVFFEEYHAIEEEAVFIVWNFFSFFIKEDGSTKDTYFV